jgi:aspartate carbamoyltransferase regulatory subunit
MTIIKKRKINKNEKLLNIVKCKNPRCITSVEQELDQVCVLTDRINGISRCKYCESKVK